MCKSKKAEIRGQNVDGRDKNEEIRVQIID